MQLNKQGVRMMGSLWDQCKKIFVPQVSISEEQLEIMASLILTEVANKNSDLIKTKEKWIYWFNGLKGSDHKAVSFPQEGLVEVNNLLEILVRKIMPLFPEGIELKVNLSTEAKEMMSKPFAVCELFINLLLHAVNATIGKGKVIVEFDEVTMRFDDPKNNKMFYGLCNGKYVRLKFFTSRDDNAELNDVIDFEPIHGTLMVPNLCRAAEDLGGKIKIANTGFKETLWEWLLPYEMEEKEENYSASYVLWMDFDKLSSKENSEYLEQKGFSVLVAQNIEQAFSLLEQYKLKIGAAFLDLGLPEARHLHHVLSILHPGLKIAALQNKKVVSLDDRPYDGVMIRPIDPQDLLQVVQQWLPTKA
jgi:CheY-like chemotaxis protein